MKKRIIGIDPGTAIIGYSILEVDGKNKYNLIDYGCIYTDNKISMPQRLEKIYNELDTIIKLYKPDEAAIEELYFYKNQKTVIKVGQARGVINLAAIKNGLDIFDYSPPQVKQGITGYGRATKKDVQEMIKQILKLEEIPKPDDAADAIAIAIMHINVTKNLEFNIRLNQDNFKKKSIKDVKTNNISNKMTTEEFKKIMSRVKK